MGIWYTWTGYFGLILGIFVSGIFKTSMVRSAAIGFVGGVVLVTVLNFADSTPAPRLQDSKSWWDILRAYHLD